MSWGFAYQGKPSDVKAVIEKENHKFDMPEEQASFNNAKASIIATLDGCSAGMVFVSASGSAYQTTGKKHCEVSLSVKPYPAVLLGANMGQWVEPPIEQDTP